MAQKTDALATQNATGAQLERPAFIRSGMQGTEHITKQDIQLPRLALAQGMTPQVMASKEGFSVGVLFNSLTEEIYGKGPINFFIVRADKPRFIEFYPRESGGGVKDMDVPADDPRTRFTTGEGGKSIKPLATKFYDFFICRLPIAGDPMEQLISLSFKSTGLKAARQLNTLIKLRNASIYAGIYELTTAVTTNPKGTFAIYQVKNAGWHATEAQLQLAEQLYQSMAALSVVVDRTGADLDDPDDFDPAKFDQPVVGQTGPEM